MPPRKKRTREVYSELALAAGAENLANNRGRGFQWERNRSSEDAYQLAIDQLCAYLDNPSTPRDIRLKCIQMGLRLKTVGGDLEKKTKFLELLGAKVEQEARVPSDPEDQGQGSGSDPPGTELGADTDRPGS